MALAWAPQQCAIQLRVPLGLLCGTVQDLSRFLTPIIEKDDLIDVSMLEIAEEELITSLKSAQEARQLGKEPEPWEE